MVRVNTLIEAGKRLDLHGATTVRPITYSAQSNEDKNKEFYDVNEEKKKKKHNNKI